MPIVLQVQKDCLGFGVETADWPCRIRIGPPVTRLHHAAECKTSKKEVPTRLPLPCAIEKAAAAAASSDASFSIESLVIEQRSSVISTLLIIVDRIFPWLLQKMLVELNITMGTPKLYFLPAEMH